MTLATSIASTTLRSIFAIARNHRAERDRAPSACQIVADAIRPIPKLKPATWAERERWLKEGATPQPGRWSNDYLPWLRPILDCFIDEPFRDGWLFMKAAQVAGSELAVTLVGYFAARMPGPILYICSTQDQAKKFARDRFDYMIENSSELRRKFDVDVPKSTLVKPFNGGMVNLTGSGSEAAVVSTPFRFVVLDEYDLLKPFPQLGSAPKVAEKRTSEYKTRCRTGIFGFAHPTTPSRGIAKAIDTTADRREWAFRCPHGEHWVIPKWDHVQITDRDADSAVFVCPECHQKITDAQRFAATKKGKFISITDPAVAAKRRFVGFHVGKLSHPLTTVRELAVEWLECVTESDRRVFFNMSMGEPYEDSSLVLTEEAILAKAESADRKERTIPENTRVVAGGVDVQEPRSNPTMYVRADAYTTDGNCVIIEYRKLRGWGALAAWIRTFEATKPDGRVMKFRGVGIDSGFMTTAVYEFCRQRAGAIECVPMKYEGRVKEDTPTITKRITDPTRPELGRMLRLELCRGYWMDRQASRWSGQSDPTIGASMVAPRSIALRTPESNEFLSHIKANSQVEIVDDNGHPQRTWIKEQSQRDDWFQAGVYAEVIAVAHGLDRWHGEAPGKPERPSDVEAGLIEPEARFHGRPRRSIAGRRRPRRGRTRGRF